MNKTLRNLIIFSIIAISIGWIAAWVNTQIPSPSPQQSLGLLLWLIIPFLAVFLLRGLGGDGWADFGLGLNLRGNGLWYALSILIYPLTIFLTLGLGAATGALSIVRPLPELLPIAILGFAMSLVKNIGEEFMWRGYLTPRFKALGLGNFTNHMLTALIWGLWHIPYWLFFLGSDLINSYTSLGMTWFIILGFIGIFPTSLVLGELRLKTGSVWPAYIAHNITNALSAQLILEGFVKFKPGAELIFSPNLDALLMMALFWAIGFWMLRKQNAQ
ncbi:MAG: CPBP family intramembrane glutamic endopeptidase [Chloroflexota bacterium]